MSSMLRILFVLLLSCAAAICQEAATTPAAPEPTATPAEQAASTPAPESTPAAMAEATPAASPESAPAASPEATPASSPESAPAATPEPSPTASAEASPAPEASPVAEASPSPTAATDTIPLEGQAAAPAGGAPLDTQDLAPALPTAPMPDAAFTDPNAIIPDSGPVPPSMPKVAENPQSKTRELIVRYREVRVQADKDPQVLAMYKKSVAATTDEDKRAALREYYRLLFKKMIEIDSSLTVRCQGMEAAYLRRLAQERLEPTIPLNPPPTPEPLTR
ncbi:hypothetical protein DB345_17640 [Spartobacteria bacterium LR76]|nr:hypothetical protein DB345_17640 [Spartobacteria bacterium LR76]